MALDREALRGEVARLVDEYAVPGAVVACWRDGTPAAAAAGVANLNTGAEMTVDTGFLTGSVTKVWTATLMMGFVEQGIIDLDAPIVEYAPEVRFGADEQVAKSLVVRNLLNHSCGVDTGDLLVASRDYPDGVEDYLGPIGAAGKLTEPDAVASYNNVGWLVAEIILRRVTGRNFHDLLRDRVIEPLGLRRTVLSAREAILHHTAIGGFPDRNGGNTPTPQFNYPTAWAAAGTTLITTVEDTIRFLRMHLNDGRSVEGNKIIGAESATAMRTPTVGHPTGPDSGFGLGWRYTHRAGHRVYSHTGGSPGGTAHVVISPADNAAMVAFVNSGAAAPMHNALVELLLPGRPSPIAPPTGATRRDIDLRPFAGTYRRAGIRTDITVEGDELLVRGTTMPAEMVGATVVFTGSAAEHRALPIDEATLVTVDHGARDGATAMHFSELEAGRYQLMYEGGRLARRIPATASPAGQGRPA